MTSQPSLLSEHVKIRSQFLRSVNLEKDHSSDLNEGYIITSTSQQILHRISEGLNNGSTFRAWTITGPYGVGKSAFAVFLTKLLCYQVSGSKSARKYLEEIDNPLAKEFGRRVCTSKGMLPIAITARRASAALCFVEGIQTSLENISKKETAPLAATCKDLLFDITNPANIILASRWLYIYL